MGRIFLQADNVFAFTISSNLSGSYNAAMAAREMVLEEHPEKKIFVLDTLSCSGALAGAAELANKLIGEDQTFDDICFALKKFADSTHILFALASFDNLAKNGRVNRVVGFIAGRLNMRVLGRRTPDGKIDFTSRPAARPACWQRFWSRWTRTNTMVSIRCSSASAAIRTPPSFCITALRPSGLALR